MANGYSTGLRVPAVAMVKEGGSPREVVRRLDLARPRRECGGPTGGYGSIDDRSVAALLS